MDELIIKSAFNTRVVRDTGYILDIPGHSKFRGLRKQGAEQYQCDKYYFQYYFSHGSTILPILFDHSVFKGYNPSCTLYDPGIMGRENKGHIEFAIELQHKIEKGCS